MHVYLSEINLSYHGFLSLKCPTDLDLDSDFIDRNLEREKDGEKNNKKKGLKTNILKYFS